MAFEPVVVEFSAPRFASGGLGGRFSKLRALNNRGNKIIIAISAAVMVISMITFAIFTVQSNNAQFQKQHGLDKNADQSASIAKSNSALPGGGVAVGIGSSSGENAPDIVFTAEPASVTVGQKSTLKWEVKGKAKSCTASEDWSGNKSVTSGSEPTPSLTKVQAYIFILTCKNDTSTSYKKVQIDVAAPTSNARATSGGQSGSGSTATLGVPVVKIAATPNIIFAGDSSTIRWEATNSPSSCTASGDWSGIKAASGATDTGKLSVAKKYSFTLICKNASGTSAAATGWLTVDTLPPGVPQINISSNPVGPVVPGSSITIMWSVTNSPTSCTASGDWSGAKAASGNQVVTNLSVIKTYKFTLSCSTSAGSSTDTAAVQVIPKPPSVSLTVSPSRISTTSTATISWSATNSPTSCTASSSNGSWSGPKASSGSISTGRLAAGTYTYSLSCTNVGGTGQQNNIPLVVSVSPTPVVTLVASPIAVAANGSSNLTWSATNSPTSCTASSSNGSWKGTKTVSGTESTGPLASSNSAYTYTLTCSNSGGTSAPVTVSVTSSNTTSSSPPTVSITLQSSTIGSAASTTLSWSATNNPSSCTATGSWSGSKSAVGSMAVGPLPAGTYTYSLSCSNSVGTSSTQSARLTVVAVPSVSVSATPNTIAAGSTTTIVWSVANSATSCTAGGNGWSGSKASTGGSQVVTLASAGTFTFTLSCTNSGGTSQSNTASVTVNAAVYCNGKTPCYSTAQMNTHNTISQCWGYNTSTVNASDKSVYDITNFNNDFHVGVKGINILPSAAVSSLCGAKNMAAYLSGAALNGVSFTHNHKDTTKQNSYASFVQYRQGYYDPAKP